MKKMDASSLLEAVVASVIFLMVLAVCLETVGSLPVGKDERFVVAFADAACKTEYLECRRGTYGPGVHTRIHKWGRVTVALRFYPPCPELLEAEITAAVEGSRKTIRYKRLIEYRKP